jgi:hypothetical protein
MGPDGHTGGHCCVKSAEAGPGSLHSWPVLGLQGQLNGSADEALEMVAARDRRPCVELAEGDDGRLGHPVPLVRGRGGGSRSGEQEEEQGGSRNRSCRERGSSRNRKKKMGMRVEWSHQMRRAVRAGRVGSRGLVGW